MLVIFMLISKCVDAASTCFFRGLISDTLILFILFLFIYLFILTETSMRFYLFE